MLDSLKRYTQKSIKWLYEKSETDEGFALTCLAAVLLGALILFII